MAMGQLGRAVAVLDVVADLETASASEIGRRLGLAKSTVHRLLNVLQVHDLVFRAESGYRLGGRAVGWVDRGQTMSMARLRSAALPHLVELHRRAGVAVALATPSREAVAYPERLYDRAQLSEIAPLLSRSPFHATATGKMLLAFDPVPGRCYSGERRLPAYTAETITSPELLDRELGRIRQAGLATCRGELFPGVTAVAAPICDHRRRVVAAVGLAGPSERVLHPGLARLVRATAAAITAVLRSTQGEPMLLSALVLPQRA